MLGTPGSPSNRVLLVNASARNLSSLTCWMAGGSAPKDTGVWPARVDPIAAPPLLKGTCKLGKIGADQIDDRNLLADEELARPVKHQIALLLDCLGRRTAYLASSPPRRSPLRPWYRSSVA